MAVQNRSMSNTYSTQKLFDLIELRSEVFRIEEVLQEGADINARDSKGNTPLLIACSYNCEAIADLLIQSGANTDCCDRRKVSVLHFAAENGWTEIVRALAKKVHNKNARDFSGDTALHRVSRLGYLNIVKILIEAGADIDHKNIVDDTPLICAASFSNDDVVDLLLKSGAKVAGNEELLLYFAARNNWTEMVQYLLLRLPDLNESYVVGETDLDGRTINGHLNVVKFLLGNGIDTRICRAAFFEAAFLGHLSVVNWLVKKMPDLNVRDCIGETGLQRASEGGNFEMVKRLVEEGVDINIRCGYGKTALHSPSMRGDLPMVKYLVRKGADINVESFDGETPLLGAARNNQKLVVDHFMHLGVNVEGSTFITYTILHFASLYGWTDILQYLVKRGWDLDRRAVYGSTAMHHACQNQQLDSVRFLLQAGANWDAKDMEGISPLNLVTSQETPEIEFIALFIEHGAYLKQVDYNELVKNFALEVLQDVRLSSLSVINQFNNHTLVELYKLPVSGILPRIEDLKIGSGTEAAQAIERAVRLQIQTKGFCNILEVRPITLSLFCVKFVLKYFDRMYSE